MDTIPSMTSKQRIEAALRGEAVDRPAMWLREGFPIAQGPAEAEDFRNGWQADPLYRELFEYVQPVADDWVNWGGFPISRRCMALPSTFRDEVLHDDGQVRRERTVVPTPRGELSTVKEFKRNEATSWVVEPLCKTRDDLLALTEIPWAFDKDLLADARRSEADARRLAGDRYPVRIFLSSPIVIISGAMELELFLELSMTERDWFLELCEEYTRRCLEIFEAYWGDGPIDSTVTFGGSEQCTPPMMSPRSFDEFVVPFDGQLVQWLKQRGALTTLHCHGRVEHALTGMVEMGVDGTDPVEPPPQGDVTYAQARDIAGDQLTLIGNLEFSDLCNAEPAFIEKQVRDILSMGTRRVILSASAGPITHVTRKLVDNYKTWIDTVREFG